MRQTPPDPAADRPRRGRGRPRSPAPDARAAILASATAEFAERGYDAASLRGVARRAGVDPALVHHYFDDKASLFAEAIDVPVRPDRLVASVLAGPRDRVGENLIRGVLGLLDAEPVRRRAVQMIRTALGHEFAARMLRQFLIREVMHKVAASIGGDDAELRATLAGSQIIGLIILRFGIAAEPLAGASVDEVVRRVGPVVQWHLVDFAGDPAAGIDSGGRAGE